LRYASDQPSGPEDQRGAHKLHADPRQQAASAWGKQPRWQAMTGQDALIARHHSRVRQADQRQTISSGGLDVLEAVEAMRLPACPTHWRASGPTVQSRPDSDSPQPCPGSRTACWTTAPGSQGQRELRRQCVTGAFPSQRNQLDCGSWPQPH